MMRGLRTFSRLPRARAMLGLTAGPLLCAALLLPRLAVAQQPADQPAPPDQPAPSSGEPSGKVSEEPTPSGSAGGAPTRVEEDPDAYAGGAPAAELLQTPVTNVFPGVVKRKPGVANPVAGDPEAATRGMQYFNAFNCSGCHAPNGGGGMGPSLSNAPFIYGSEPANIYLSIYQGRPGGMPTFGGTVPDSVIWDLVTYIKGISKPWPGQKWGVTVSADTMKVEQVPTEFGASIDPWSQTESFSHGQRPNAAR